MKQLVLKKFNNGTVKILVNKEPEEIPARGAVTATIDMVIGVQCTITASRDEVLEYGFNRAYDYYNMDDNDLLEDLAYDFRNTGVIVTDAHMHVDVEQSELRITNVFSQSFEYDNIYQISVMAQNRDCLYDAIAKYVLSKLISNQCLEVNLNNSVMGTDCVINQVNTHIELSIAKGE